MWLGNAVTSSTLHADPPIQRNHRCVLYQNLTAEEKLWGSEITVVSPLSSNHVVYLHLFKYYFGLSTNATMTQSRNKETDTTVSNRSNNLNYKPHSFSILSDDRSKASSKTMPPYSAIQSLLLQMRISSPVLKVIQ